MAQRKIDQSAIERMMLAKRLFQKGTAACSSQLDPFEFSSGILALQDAVELALGVIAYLLGAPLKPKMAFLEYFGKINAAWGPGKELPYQRELSLLNDARVQIKHFGFIKRPGDHAQAIGAVRPFLEYACRTFLDRDLERLSLADMIPQKEIREFIKAAEAALEKNTNGDRRECVRNLAYAKYMLFDYEFDGVPLDEGALQALVTVPTNYVEQEVRALSLGLSVAAFRQLGLILPKTRWNRRKSALELTWDEEHCCHEGNWTDANLRWAIEFVTEMAMKAGAKAAVPHIQTAEEYFHYEITAVADEALFYESLSQALVSKQVEVGSGVTIQQDWGYMPAPGQEPIFRLKKGETITGTAKRHWDQSWYRITSPKIGKEEVFVAADSVDVAKMPRNSGKDNAAPVVAQE